MTWTKHPPGSGSVSSAGSGSTSRTRLGRSGQVSRTNHCYDAEFARWWATRDSNPDGLPHTPLKRARLPVPPAALLSPSILPCASFLRHREQGRHSRPVARRRRDTERLAAEPFPQRRSPDPFGVPGVDLLPVDGEPLVWAGHITELFLRRHGQAGAQ